MKLPLVSEIKFDKKKLFDNFKDINNIGNFKMLKCTKLLFDKKNFFKNSGNYLLMFLLPLSLISLFVFVFYNRTNINTIIIKFKLRDENDKNNNDNKNDIKYRMIFSCPKWVSAVK